MSSNSLLEQTGAAVRHRRRRAVRAAFAYLVVLGLTCLVFVWTPPGQRLDAWLLPRADRGGGFEQRDMPVDGAVSVLSLLGEPVLLGAFLVVILLLGVLRRRWRLGVAGAGVVLGSTLVANVLKAAIPRPELGVPGSTTHNSFPSGHVTVATSLLLAVLLVVPARARGWVALLGTAGVSVVGAATMIAGWHRFSDLVGGLLVSAAVLGLALALLPAEPESRDAGAGSAAMVFLAPVFTAFGAAALDADEGLFIGMVAASACAAVVVASVVLVLRTTARRVR